MITVGMSTSCVFPLPLEAAFRLARDSGFDGIEIMVTADPLTRDATALATLSARYGLPILSVHSPVLLFTQLVWGSDPARKLHRSAELAAAVGARTVVVHPPYRWQPRYARDFESHLREVAARFAVEIAVENMFPLPVAGSLVRAFAPSSDPVLVDCDAITLDFSHAALAGRDSLEYALAMGDRLRHVHLSDGTASTADGQLHDEHLVPGHGTQPVAEVLHYLASSDWNGSVIAEVHTGAMVSEATRLEQLRETRAFAASHIEAGVRARRAGRKDKIS